MAIDSCRRTSNPNVNFMEKWKGIVGSVGGEFVTRLISEVPIFSVFVLQKPPVVYKHFICLKFKEIGIYNRNVVLKKRKI